MKPTIEYRGLKHWKYQLLSTYTIRLPESLHPPVLEARFMSFANAYLVIYKGYCWDGPSGPTIDTKSFMRGSLTHDVLYQLIREGKLPPAARKPADELLREICIEDGMSRFRAWYCYRSLRMFGAAAARPKK